MRAAQARDTTDVWGAIRQRLHALVYDGVNPRKLYR